MPQVSNFDETDLMRLGVSANQFVILPAQVRHCHLQLPDLDKPIAGLEYESHSYSIFRACAQWAEVEKITSRLTSKYVITVTKKGWVIWIFEF